MWDSLVERVQEFFFNMLVSAINSLLGTTANIFEKSIDNVQSGIVETPEQFSPIRLSKPYASYQKRL